MKYMGSKKRISKDLLSIILQDRKCEQFYIEPFCGGCNVIDEVNDIRCIASDSNFYLIDMFRALQKGWNPPQKVSKEFYYKVKNEKSMYPTYLVGYIGFNCSYSGKWFGGFAGETKTKQGIRDYQIEAYNNIIKQVKNLNNVKFLTSYYDTLFYPDKSIIYCDPPYKLTTKYKESFDSNKFWNWVRDMVNLNHKVFISEYQAPEDFKCIWKQTLTSSLSANGKSGGNKTSIEKLFVHNSVTL